MCGLDGADSEVCLDGCSGYEALIDEDEFAYRYYTVSESVAGRKLPAFCDSVPHAAPNSPLFCPRKT